LQGASVFIDQSAKTDKQEFLSVHIHLPKIYPSRHLLCSLNKLSLNQVTHDVVMLVKLYQPDVTRFYYYIPKIRLSKLDNAAMGYGV